MVISLLRWLSEHTTRFGPYQPLEIHVFSNVHAKNSPTGKDFLNNLRKFVRLFKLLVGSRGMMISYYYLFVLYRIVSDLLSYY